MKTSRTHRLVAAAVLGSGFALAGVAAPAIAGTAGSLFTAGTTGTFVVPAGVTAIQVTALGGSGGGLSPQNSSWTGGAGALIVAELTVAPGEIFNVNVGGNGDVNDGGTNGGGDGGAINGAGGGGGASDLRTGGDALSDRVLVAAGGGGLSTYWPGADADTDAGSVNFCPGTGPTAGSQTMGGTGTQGCTGTPVSHGSDGGPGQGGAGGTNSDNSGGQASGGGGGGGGLYGGGGGGAYAGGAGGSSYHDPTITTSFSDTTGTFGNSPFVDISYTLTAATVQVATSAPKILANGTSTATITATVLDAFSNQVPGDTVTIASSDPAQVISAVVDNGDGTYTATVTSSTTVHATTITATDTSVRSDPSGVVTVNQVASLATTGVDPGPALDVAVFLLLAGVILTVARRRTASS